MNKETLKSMINLLDDNDTETIFSILVRFIPEVPPETDEIEAIERANESIRKYGTIPSEAINWD